MARQPAGSGAGTADDAAVGEMPVPAALPLLLLWVAAPVIAFVLSRPVPSRREALNAGDRAFLLDVARKTWHYFETFMGHADHALPPDNVQVAGALPPFFFLCGDRIP